MDKVTAVLRPHHFRDLTAPDDNGDVRNLYAESSGSARSGPSSRTVVRRHPARRVPVDEHGLQERKFAAPVGTKVAVEHGTSLTIGLRRSTETYFPDGSPKDYASDIVLYKDGGEVSGTGPGQPPMRTYGVSFFQSFFGFVGRSCTSPTRPGKVAVRTPASRYVAVRPGPALHRRASCPSRA